jgi:hypothetical protein
MPSCQKYTAFTERFPRKLKLPMSFSLFFGNSSSGAGTTISGYYRRIGCILNAFLKANKDVWNGDKGVGTG